MWVPLLLRKGLLCLKKLKLGQINNIPMKNNYKTLAIEHYRRGSLLHRREWSARLSSIEILLNYYAKDQGQLARNT